MTQRAVVYLHPLTSVCLDVATSASHVSQQGGGANLLQPTLTRQGCPALPPKGDLPCPAPSWRGWGYVVLLRILQKQHI